MSFDRLNDRASLILKYLVEQYILEGEPVSSKSLVQLPGLEVSSATIRNALSELENADFVMAPHRSAGRIPTALGLRYFVDHLLVPVLPQEVTRQEAAEAFDRVHPTTTLVKQASTILSKLTHWVGVVTVPKVETLILRHIEFLPLSANRALAVLVVNERDVHNRLICTQQAYSAADLHQAANFLNQHFSGQDLMQVRQRLLVALRADHREADQVMKTAIEMASQAFEPTGPTEDSVMMVSGADQALAKVRVGSVGELQQWAHAFAEKQQILEVLQACLTAQGVQIFIGEESGQEQLANCSLITTSYHVNGKPVGVLGVIGPTRMQYEQVIPVVDMTAKLLSSALKTQSEAP